MIALCLLFNLLGFAAFSTAPGDEPWLPVDPAHLALKTPTVERDADAEAIFWDVQVDYSSDKMVLANYVRIKVFTERGKEKQSQVDLPYLGKDKIEAIAGRTIRPDGSVVELRNDSIFDRQIIKGSGLKVSVRSFALPAVEPGVIIEYRWRETRRVDPLFVRLPFQQEIPIHRIKYTFKASLVKLARFKQYNMQDVPLMPEGKDSFSYTLADVPAFRREPFMPPDDQVRRWMLIQPKGPYLYSDIVYGFMKERLKVGDEVRQAAAAAMGDAVTDEQKLERLFEFCRAKIKNVEDDSSGLTDTTRSQVKENKSPADTLRRGIGTSEEINLLFCALAEAAGFTARPAYVASRDDLFYTPSQGDFLGNLYFMRSSKVAVRVGSEWRFFDPASRYVPYNGLRWQEEGVKAMILDPVQTLYVPTPISDFSKSVQKRVARLALAADGTLEGDVRIEYTGHFAVEKKEAAEKQSPEEIEKMLRDLIKEVMVGADVSNVKFENMTDTVKPLVHSFHIRVPEYAQRTGRRLFLQPAFFQKGIAAMFTAGERKYPIYFHYTWREEDEVVIKLPAGYTLDNADRPSPFREDGLVDYDVKIYIVGKMEELLYKRTFSFNALYIPQDRYQPLKQMFDLLHESDGHTITLRQAAGQ
jgi:hypothetical protein